MVLLEAMAAGLPVISTAAGGAGEVVGESGLLFEVGNSDKLSLLMEQVVELNSQERKKYQQLMEQRINRFFTDQVAKEEFFKFEFVKQIVQQVE